MNDIKKFISFENSVIFASKYWFGLITLTHSFRYLRGSTGVQIFFLLNGKGDER
jgi:hypothetical protein